MTGAEMAERSREGAKVSFRDGREQTWVPGEGVTLSGAAIAEVLRVCMKGDIESIEPVIIDQAPTQPS